jgi:hypothetical protein
MLPGGTSTLVLRRLYPRTTTRPSILPTQDLLIKKYPFLKCCTNLNLACNVLLDSLFLLFKQCPLLSQWAHEHDKAYTDFMTYRLRVPVCGAIILNSTMDKCLLVKGWSSKAGWGFPKGKINQNEENDNCAVREVSRLFDGIKCPDCILLCRSSKKLDTTFLPYYARTTTSKSL